jgi:flagellar motility protein MotE (MotC chaperone)
MISVNFKTFASAFLVFLFFLVSGSYAQEPKVVFECGDIGVEARRMLEKLSQEEKRLGKKEKELQNRENELKILEVEVDKKIEQLKNLRKDLDEVLAQKDETENQKVKQLSKIYQKRNPAGAAESLAAMDKNLAVSILAGMRDKYAGEILDNMEPEIAVAYSTALGRLGK